jgi:plasmid replication initiation protein
MKKKTNFVVTKSNHLIEASYRLNLDEQRLVLSCIAKIDSRKQAPDLITVTVDDFAEAYGLDMKNAYVQLRNATDSLYERDIKIKDENLKTKERIRWVQRVKYYEGEGKVDLAFSDVVKTYLGGLSSRFTSFKLKQVSSLQSVYSIRLFELLTQFQSLGERTIRVQDLRVMLGIEEDKYAKFAGLKRRVIDPAVKELNAKTNFAVGYKPIRDGRAIVALEFSFKESDQLKLKLRF